MKKRLLSILLTICMVVTMAPTVFAKTFDYEDLPDYLAEQDQGLYIAAQRITESGYYLLSPMASGTTNGYSTLSTEGASESNYHVYVDLDSKQITLNNATIEIATPETNTVDNKPDMSQNPVGVLCETRGTASSDSGASTAFQTLSGYSLVTAGIAVLNQTGDWTITLVGNNIIDIDSNFAAPNRNAHLAMPVYGIYVPGSALTIQGEGTLDADVTNNQNCRSEGIGLCMPTTGVYANGLEISESSVNISAGSDRAGALNLSLYYPNDSGSYFGAVVSTGDLKIDEGAEVSVSDSLNWSTGVTAVGNITITGEETAVEVETSGANSYALGFSPITEGNSGTGNVTIDSGAVTIATSGSGSVGIAGSTLTISGKRTEINVSMSGDDSTGLAGATMTVSEADVTVNAEGEYSQAVSGTDVTLSTGSYNTEIPEEYLSDGAAVVNGSVTEDIPAADEITAFIGSNLYTGENGGNLAITAVPVTGGEVWLKVDTTADRTGLTIGNEVTIYVAKGAAYTGSFIGDGIVAQIIADGQETRDGVTYDKYIYKMVADSVSAPIKVIKADSSEFYYNSFDGDGAYGTGASSNLSEGDTIVLLDNIELTSDISIGEDNVTLDLNGKTLSNPNGDVINAQYGSVIIVDNSAEQTGKVIAGGRYGAAVKGSATIYNGEFSGTDAVYGTGDYDITIYGGKFIGELSGTLYIHDGDFTEATLEDTHSITESFMTEVNMGGNLKGQSDTDVLTWSVVPNGDTVVIDGQEWSALTLTFAGNGAMGDYSTYNRPWCCFNGQITEVVIAEGVTRIGRSTFEEFEINNSFTIPASMTEIPAKTFYLCNITEYIVSEGNINFAAEDGVLFNADKTTLIAYPDGAEPLAEYTIPETATTLQGYAFYGSDLKSLTLPENWDMTTSYGIGTSTNTDEYRYVGWYKDAAYTNKLTSMGSDVYVPAECKGTTIYAKWLSDITLDSNGGTLERTSLEVAHGHAIGTLPNGTRGGYSLVGYNTQADGRGTAVTETTIPTGHDTYYAIWGQTSGDGSNNVIVLGIPDQTYTGSAITPDVYYTVDGGEQQIANNVTYEDNTAVGTATVKFEVSGILIETTFNIVNASYDTNGIVFANQTFDYDGQPHYLEVVGLPEGVSVTYENNGQTDFKSGGYTVTAKFTVPAGYDEIADKTAKLIINRAYVQFVADDLTMYVGEEVPTLTYQVISQVTGEPLDYDFGFTPELSCSAEGDTVGNFPIRISGVPEYQSYGNYRTSYTTRNCVDGNLTVGMKIMDASITYANDTVIYDGEEHNLEITVDGTLPDSFTVEYFIDGEPFTGVTDAGTYEITAIISCSDPAYAQVLSMTATLTITPATLTITADDVTIYAGDDLPELTYSVDGLVTGDSLISEPTLSCDADTNVYGTYEIVIEDAVATDNYTIDYVNGELTVEKKPSSGFNYDAWYWALMMLYNQQFDVSASASEGGTITPDGISKVKYDKNITYTITPDEGYAISDVLVNGESVGAVSEYTIKRIKKAQTIHAIFVKTAWENPYTDVSDEAWYYEDVEFVSGNGLMIGTGDNKFSPSAIVNRAMLVTVLWRLEGSPVVDSPVDFYDIPADEWYTAAVNWAAANGIVNGYGDGIFGAMNDLTHEQIMAILNRYAVYKQWSENVSGNADDSYTNSEWAENNVLWADLYGMFDGIGSDISDLTEGADRAELAAYLRRFCERFMAE